MTEKILEAIERYDKIMRPKVVILNPETKDLILKEHPEIEKDFPDESHPLIPRGFFRLQCGGITDDQCQCCLWLSCR